MKKIRILFFYFLFMTILLCGVYPAAIWGIGQVFFKDKAEGSFIHKDGKVIGSLLIGQPFTSPKYFWSRPSATAGGPYNFLASGGSNLNPTNEKLLNRIKDEQDKLLAVHGTRKPIPLDLLTTSGSGLDPHISPSAALYQVERIAKERKLPVHTVYNIVLENIRPRTFGFLGEPRVNILRLNLQLDATANEREGL